MTSPQATTDDLFETPGLRRRSMTLVTWAWVFGSIWITAIGGAPVAKFAQALKLSEFQFGLLSAMPFVAAMLSLPSSLLIDHSGQRKRIFMIALLVQRMMWLAIALLPTWLVLTKNYDAAVIGTLVFLPMIFLMHAGGAIGNPAWMSWMADVVPEPLRGRYFTRRRQLGTLSAIPAAFLAGFILNRYAGDNDPARVLKWCAIIFAPAAICGVIDILLFSPIPHRAPVRAPSTRFWQTLIAPLRDKQFMIFSLCIAIMTMALAPMGTFITLFFDQRLKIAPTQIQLILLVAPAIGQLLILPFWGRMADRFGKKPLLVLSVLGMIPVGAGWVLMNGGHLWLGYVLSTAGAMLWAGGEVANFNMVLEFAGSRRERVPGASSAPRGSGYVAVNGMLCNVGGIAGGVAAGLVMSRFEHFHWQPIAAMPAFGNFELLFLLSASLRLLALCLLPFVHEPAGVPTAHVIRLVVSGLYNNIAGALTPMRADPDRKPI